jgi:hypothetical protein
LPQRSKEAKVRAALALQRTVILVVRRAVILTPFGDLGELKCCGCKRMDGDFDPHLGDWEVDGGGYWRKESQG